MVGASVHVCMSVCVCVYVCVVYFGILPQKVAVKALPSPPPYKATNPPVQLPYSIALSKHQVWLTMAWTPPKMAATHNIFIPMQEEGTPNSNVEGLPCMKPIANATAVAIAKETRKQPGGFFSNLKCKLQSGFGDRRTAHPSSGMASVTRREEKPSRQRAVAPSGMEEPSDAEGKVVPHVMAVLLMVGIVLVAVVTERDPEQEERERREFMLAIGYSEDGELEDLPKEVRCKMAVLKWLLPFVHGAGVVICSVCN